jgi:hypothetical protein
VAGVQDNAISRLPERTHEAHWRRGAREGEVMATFTGSDDLQGAEFVDADLRGARFRRADLSGVVMRAVDVREADIDAPWLFKGESFLRVNGEEWEHHRYAVRDLDTIEATSGA